MADGALKLSLTLTNTTFCESKMTSYNNNNEENKIENVATPIDLIRYILIHPYMKKYLF